MKRIRKCFGALAIPFDNHFVLEILQNPKEDILLPIPKHAKGMMGKKQFFYQSFLLPSNRHNILRTFRLERATIIYSLLIILCFKHQSCLPFNSPYILTL